MGDADRLPMANVSRIIQNSLPKDSAIAKEARVALSPGPDFGAPGKGFGGPATGESLPG